MHKSQEENAPRNLVGSFGNVLMESCPRVDVDHVPWSVWTVFHRVPK